MEKELKSKLTAHVLDEKGDPNIVKVLEIETDELVSGDLNDSIDESKTAIYKLSRNFGPLRSSCRDFLKYPFHVDRKLLNQAGSMGCRHIPNVVLERYKRSPKHT